MGRKMFCQLSPATYRISVLKCKTLRWAKNLLIRGKIARTKQADPLPIVLHSHKSLIRRTPGNVDAQLQNNKAVNLSIAAPKVSNVLIRPGQIFSFWSLVGSCTPRKGYLEGLVIGSGQVSKGFGGGMCQFTNLIHWLVLHTPLDIVEHHHHDGIDLFPDFGRQVPFGVGTSIAHNYLDYRFQNNTQLTFQLMTWTTQEYLCGEIRADGSLGVKYHIKAENEHFTRENGVVYRNGQIYRECIDVHTGNLLKRELIKNNHARVLYEMTEV